MNDLISKSALLEKVNDIKIQYYVDLSGRYSPFIKAKKIINHIECAPTVEAKLVVHGEWVHEWNCSECGCSYMDYADGDSCRDYSHPLPNFCPNCGADMRGGKNE